MGPELLDALRAALDGGPAVLPLPTDRVEAARVTAALRLDEPLEEADACLVVPTSGSTGQPKGVLLTAACLRASALATAERLGGSGSWLAALPPTHIAGLQLLVRSLLADRPPVALPPGPFTPAAFCTGTAALPPGRRYTSLVPTQLRRLLAGAALQALRSYDAVLLGGAATPPALLEQARCAGVRVVTTYGMTETSGGCIYDGVPLDGVRVAVDGRIRLAGPVLALGYRLRPDLTAESFAGGWFTTGDLGELGPDGRLVIHGRADDVVVTGGEKVAPSAVEAALSAHPAVVEAVVVGLPDREWGQRVVAVVVLRAPLTLQQAREHVAASLPRVAAPRELRVVRALPLLASGKIDRAAVRSQT